MGMRHEKIRTSQAFRDIVDEARSRLETVGKFSKKDVLEAVGLLSIPVESIRWDLVEEELQQEEGCELIRVSSRFFLSQGTKLRRNAPIEIAPQKYLSGHGKATAGYITARRDENAQLVIVRIQSRDQQLRTQTRHHVQGVQALIERGSDVLRDQLNGPEDSSQQSLPSPAE